MLKITADAKTHQCKVIADGSVVSTLTEFVMAAIAMQAQFQYANPALGESVAAWLTTGSPGSFMDQMRHNLAPGSSPVRAMIDLQMMENQMREEKENG